MRKKQTWLRRALSAVLALALTASMAAAPAFAAEEEMEEFQWTELTNYETSWLGNDYPGHGENGYGEWVQNFIENVDFVNGTVVTSALWDEAGRCTGLYRDGNVNTVMLQTSPARPAWGWGTGSAALAADETNIWLYTNAHDLLRFTWDYQKLDSHKYVGYAESPGALAVSMTEMDNTLYALREGGTVETWDGIALTKKAADFVIPDAKKLVIDKATGELWVIVGNEIKNYSTEGQALGRTISGVGNPVNVAIDEKDGYLIVTDDGNSQQVLFYDISGSGTPTKVKAFGEYGGIGSGTPGEYEPLKLFALRGAGTDKEGNIYVALSRRESVVRKFTPDGELVWERASFPFIDSADFLPGTDGEVVYGIDEIYEMDYSKSYGEEATITAITRDLVKYPGEREAEDRPASNLWVRVIDGKTVLFMNGMTMGNSNGKSGLDMYVFDPEPSKIAHYVGSFDGPDGNWAYDIDENGALWVGSDNGKIVRYDFGGFDKNGCPIYSKEKSETFDTPAPFTKISRIIYDEATDKMFLFGYTEDYPETSWGLIGRVLRAFDWKDGKAVPIYTTIMPMEPEGNGNMLDPKAVDVAGDYIFAVTCRMARVHIYSAINGEYVGTMRTEPELGTSGWVDIPHGIRATKRSNGEYVVIVEEDWRAKNAVYRWTPDPLTGLPYNEEDVNTIKSFLAAGNNEKELFTWSADDPGSWKGITWEEVDGERKIASINLVGKEVSGKELLEGYEVDYGSLKPAAITLEKEKDIRYVNGYPDGTFGPEAGITRAEVAAIFYRLIVAEDKEEAKTVSFSDVSESDWYYEAVAYLENHGLISGYPDGTFGPGNSITRAEFVTIASRFDTLSEGNEGQYSDVTDEHWASAAIYSAAAKGWVGGYPDGTFLPNANITRAQVVAVVNRMLGKKADASDFPESANQFTDLSSDHWAYADILEATTGE